jgi:hypothetical protein
VGRTKTTTTCNTSTISPGLYSCTNSGETEAWESVDANAGETQANHTCDLDCRIRVWRAVISSGDPSCLPTLRSCCFLAVNLPAIPLPDHLTPQHQESDRLLSVTSTPDYKHQYSHLPFDISRVPSESVPNSGSLEIIVPHHSQTV